jgi:hypothetical protein
MTVFARKTCTGPCSRQLSIVHGFYRDYRYPGGYMSICKDCKRASVRENRELKLDYYRAKGRQKSALPYYRQQRRDYAQTPRGQEVMRAARARYRRWKAIEQRA